MFNSFTAFIWKGAIKYVYGRRFTISILDHLLYREAFSLMKLNFLNTSDPKRLWLTWTILRCVLGEFDPLFHIKLYLESFNRYWVHSTRKLSELFTSFKCHRQAPLSAYTISLDCDSQTYNLKLENQPWPLESEELTPMLRAYFRCL